jgi:hypothetical protein
MENSHREGKPYDEEEAESLLESPTTNPDNGIRREHHQRLSLWAMRALFLGAMLAIGATGFYIGSLVPTNKVCAQKYTTWSRHPSTRGSRMMLT